MYYYKDLGNGHLQEIIGGKIPDDAIASEEPIIYTPPVVPAPEPYVPTAEEIAAQTRAQLEFAVDNFMDSKARAKGFRDRHSFALRAGITGSSWHDQAQVFGAWMDTVNDYCWQVLEDCKAGTRTVPTIEELLAELPGLEGE